MPADSTQPIRRTRRWFLGAIGGAVAATAVRDATALAAPAGHPNGVRFFDVVHDPSIAVSMTDGRRFEVCVKRMSTGEILERHERVTARNLLRLESAHIRIVERSGP